MLRGGGQSQVSAIFLTALPDIFFNWICQGLSLQSDALSKDVWHHFLLQTNWQKVYSLHSNRKGSLSLDLKNTWLEAFWGDAFEGHWLCCYVRIGTKDPTSIHLTRHWAVSCCNTASRYHAMKCDTPWISKVSTLSVQMPFICDVRKRDQDDSFQTYFHH